MLWSNCDLKNASRKSGVYAPPKSRGPQTTFCRRFRSLAAYLPKETRYNAVSALKTMRCFLYIVSKRRELKSTNGLKLDLHFAHPTYTFCIPIRCQASQTEISKQNSSKLCQTADSKLHIRHDYFFPPEFVNINDVYLLANMTSLEGLWPAEPIS